jgi:hypothetical protein
LHEYNRAWLKCTKGRSIQGVELKFLCFSTAIIKVGVTALINITPRNRPTYCYYGHLMEMGDQPHAQPQPSLRKNNRQYLFKEVAGRVQSHSGSESTEEDPCLCSETKRQNTARALVTTDRCIPTPAASLAVVIVLLHLYSYASLNDGDTF